MFLCVFESRAAVELFKPNEPISYPHDSLLCMIALQVLFIGTLAFKLFVIFLFTCY